MSRGHDRERAVRKELESQGWFVARACGSLGDVDLVALRFKKHSNTQPQFGPAACSEAWLIEVKSSPYAFAHFGPQDRTELLAAAKRAGASAVLAHWPPRGKLTLIWPNEWPESKVAA